ncbi:MAG: hypothetical protein ACI89X_000092 [Planctomycetota bacterium]|jgi:hypothetical protein
MKLPTKLLSLCLATACAMLASCASTTKQVIANDSYVLSIVDDAVSVSCKSPIPVSEFLKMAQLVTHGRYTFHRDDADTEVSWVGNLTCDRTEFNEFVKTMLYTKGLALESRQQGDNEFFEVCAIKRG